MMINARTQHTSEEKSCQPVSCGLNRIVTVQMKSQLLRLASHILVELVDRKKLLMSWCVTTSEEEKRTREESQHARNVVMSLKLASKMGCSAEGKYTFLSSIDQ
ncbi:hypothetical protein BaRGS_00027484 [Batillaria attramentaria]|uniref:Uncharacterized protein n=1 Tax=Batillaria attramentaria TaxID=370345 RepID=A0ABD0K214_9CAEN